MRNSKRLSGLATLLSGILTLAGCESLGLFARDYDIAPSTFCQIYRPVRPPEQFDGGESDAWWDAAKTPLQNGWTKDEIKAKRDSYSAVMQNNLTWIKACAR